MSRILSIGLALGLVALMYWMGWIRFDEERPPRREPATRVPKEVAGSELKILAFYPNKASVVAGESATVCYGVLNAAKLELDPPVARVTPSFNRCFEVTPQRETTYKLRATASDGRSVEASFQLPVGTPPARFLYFSVSSGEVRRGEPVTFCYGVANATGVQLEPLGVALAPLEKNCWRWTPDATREYRVTARGPGGAAEPLGFTIKVK